VGEQINEKRKIRAGFGRLSRKLCGGPAILIPIVRLLCLSDIHGHAEALSAVLATAERRGYSRILVAGDICFPGPRPLDTWRRLSQLKALCVQGVGDRAVATLDPTDLRPRDAYEKQRLDRLVAVRAELGDVILRRLAKLPQVLHHPISARESLLLVHGSPVDPMEPLTHDMEDAAIAHLLGDDPSPLVLCGGSHVPFDRTVERSGPGLPPATRVINLGSVGEAPSGDLSRFAHATFIESSEGGIEVEQFVVPLGRAA
jgi:predicted phosphodiesterase